MTTASAPVDVSSSGSRVEHGPTLISIGYEGRSLEGLIESLLVERVQVLVDVRLHAFSRKPGLSKTKLSEALNAAGIEYVHHRALGNPRDNREGFRNGDSDSRRRFREVLSTDEAERAIAHVMELLDGGAVALLCYERDHATCHRDLVAAELLAAMPRAEIIHL
ncbi:DUF488 domain-containing protein [Nocardia puris]|uniref:Uncharacterized protein DUF488 n=1 Tax=Nocardia puris TaxID=208602 RepID=A0A366DPD4_9NOCA|nr:DUF488 domain-containing protein [Nocardia puris]RBO91775.1 uncharacterized protein DUF488 [Nocardia puris]